MSRGSRSLQTSPEWHRCEWDPPGDRGVNDTLRGEGRIDLRPGLRYVLIELCRW